MVYADGSEYRGGFVNGLKHGYGYYLWPKPTTASDAQTGHIYVGNWKQGLMHGAGKFQHSESFVLEPTFSNNLAQIPNGTFVNPLMSKKETEDYLKGIQRSRKDYEQSEI